jgi:hypothetical protein
MYKNHKLSGTFQTGDITNKGRSDQIKDLRRDVMIKGCNESRDVLNRRGRSGQGRNNIAPIPPALIGDFHLFNPAK